MSIRENERLFKAYVSKVYFERHDGLSVRRARAKHPFPELSDADRAAVYDEAERHITEVKAYLRRNANQWLWLGGGLVALSFLIVAVVGEPEAGRNIGRMWLGYIVGVALIAFGIWKKIKPL